MPEDDELNSDQKEDPTGEPDSQQLPGDEESSSAQETDAEEPLQEPETNDTENVFIWDSSFRFLNC